MPSPIILFPGSHMPIHQPAVRRPIYDSTNTVDLRPWFENSAAQAGIPLALLVGCGIAESGLNTTAARYGVWPDVSFGISQTIVLYHYYGNHTNTTSNITAVRDYVFAHPDVDIDHMAQHLAGCLVTIRGRDLSRVGGDANLAACVVYNFGSYPDTNNGYWTTWAANMNRYRNALTQAATMI